ncbi:MULTISPECIES: TetR/AcrR family transcriptional regulator [Micrococcus]|uniref:TetR/AcrR family transcriptional regulator n=1 Tax=Micrococcus lylae TaxID=1273 RepID=A0ABY2JYN9_9MICC|nr:MULTISPECIES: TetR/AcrR family transcriptional regulator [Micrococcus]OFR88318.1 TetR family transcriptional regulator [Micrococcus sp. HMSC067E09]TFH98769.1 TetR/AcrR family transcriptional regulator [Micrococcus lylae]WIK81508.1 TetR/AcrR family transcriptional regulator [Micrococcus lylae]
MPRLVDHDARRRELVETTWKVVADRGLSGATLRQIAEEAGYANGALKPYFPTKSALIEATYAHVFERTEARIDAALADARGVEAMRRLCREVIPRGDELVREARLVLSFWDQAARQEAEALAAAATMAAWRDRLHGMLAEAAVDGMLRPDIPTGPVVEALLAWLFGTQVTAVMDPERHGPDSLDAQLEAFLALLSA